MVVAAVSAQKLETDTAAAPRTIVDWAIAGAPRA
jgi:hypothetical protein